MKRSQRPARARGGGRVAVGPRAATLTHAVAVSLWLSANLACVAESAPPRELGTSQSYEADVVPLLQKYCYECHGNGRSEAGLALDGYKNVADVRADRREWANVLEYVTRHEMPPRDAAAFPSNGERERIAAFVERELYQIDPDHPDPGRVTLRRLNRAEYGNAIRDLTGVEIDTAVDFPPDDSGYGFDNNGDVLSLPPVLLEKYLATAEKVFDQAIVTEPIRSRVKRVPASLATIGFNAIGDRGDGWVHLISLEEDDVDVQLPIVAGGDYLVRFQAYATKVGGALVGQGSEKPLQFAKDPGPTHMALALNDVFVKSFEITTDEKKPGIYEARVGVAAGHQSFRAVMRRKRSGENELEMLNGRLGKQQPGIVFVKWMEIEGPLESATRRFAAAQLAATGPGRNESDGSRTLTGNGDVAVEIDVPRDGDVILRAQAFAQQAGADPARMQFRIDGRPLQTFDVLAPARMAPLPRQRVFSLALLAPQPELFELTTRLTKGRHSFSAAFVNDFADPENENPNLRARNLTLRNLEVAVLSSPVVTPPLPAPLRELFARHASAEGEPAVARQILGDFTRRAWRRPVADAELDRLQGLYTLAREHGDSFEAGVKLALEAALASPHFLLLGEPTRAGGDRLEAPLANGAKAALIDEFSLASRISFFLWSSISDDELLALAGRGELRASLTQQVRRMLASPKAHALVDNFAGQWLQIRSLETAAPDPSLFPDYDPNLRAAMQRETAMFFEYVLREDRSIFDFLRGDYTFVDARLAKLYGLPDVLGEDFQKVSLAGTPRRGVLTQASVLTLTSNPTRTSPVKRGKWVLENLLGAPPPPPPPDVPELDDAERNLKGTLRQQMEQHRTDPTCASCHARMDPIGFGLENFDAIGAWRDTDGEAAIDPSGTLASGDAFAGAAELADLLASRRADDFRRCLSEKLLIYALGRGVEYYDRPALDQIMSALRAGDDRFSALILAVAESFPFQNRRAEAAAPASEH